MWCSDDNNNNDRHHNHNNNGNKDKKKWEGFLDGNFLTSSWHFYLPQETKARMVAMNQLLRSCWLRPPKRWMATKGLPGTPKDLYGERPERTSKRCPTVKRPSAIVTGMHMIHILNVNSRFAEMCWQTTHASSTNKCSHPLHNPTKKTDDPVLPQVLPRAQAFPLLLQKNRQVSKTRSLEVLHRNVVYSKASAAASATSSKWKHDNIP